MRTRLVWKQKLVIPHNVVAIMEWCKRNGYRSTSVSEPTKHQTYS